MSSLEPPVFNSNFKKELEQLLTWRRDVRRFKKDPVPETIIEHCLKMAQHAPSVGNSCPWRWVRVQSATARTKIRENFETCNANALATQTGERAELYAKLKLAGLDNAPVQFAVFCETGAEYGHGLGRNTMPEMLHYSAVLSVMNFWLAARAAAIGVGWVSILDPNAINNILDMPTSSKFIAYLCVGFPVEEHIDPELHRYGWQSQNIKSKTVLIR